MAGTGRRAWRETPSRISASTRLRVAGWVENRLSAPLPFSYGPRACIGKNLAMSTIYLTMARIAFLFEIESREELPLEFHVKDHFAAGDKNGPFLKFIPRDPRYLA